MNEPRFHVRGLEAINAEAFMSLYDEADGESRFIQALAEIFIITTPGELRQLRKALTSKDHQALRAMAHRLKSGAYSLGAVRFSFLCLALEKEEWSESEAMGLMKSLEEEYRQVHDELIRLCWAQ